MKDRLHILPAKALTAFSMVLGFLPLFLLAGVHFLPHDRGIWFLLPSLSLTWGILGYCLPKRIRLPFALVGSAGLIAAAFLLTPAYGFPGPFIPVIPCIALLVAMPSAWGRPAWDEWPLPMWIAGILVHLVSRFFQDMIQTAGVKMILDMGFVLYLFCFLTMMNRQGLRSGMHGSQKAPAVMRRRNQLLLLALFIPAALAACWGVLGRLLDELWHWIGRLIGNAVSWLMSLLESDQIAMVEGPMGMPQQNLGGLMEAEGEKSMFSQIIEIVFIVMASILALAALIVFIWFLGKKFLALIDLIKQRLRRFAAASAEDYVDEAESTLDMDEQAKLLRAKIKKAFSRPRQIPWDELDGRARVRRLYQQFLQKKPQVRGLTAREALHQEKKYSQAQAASFADLYEKARYSRHDIAAEAADQLRRQVK
ncbi:MAG: DUF4129 domain-containing protein [Clostridia bacterium]|nr:DUF4129 domain-containing protein [Clostridia bacterium]